MSGAAQNDPGNQTRHTTVPQARLATAELGNANFDTSLEQGEDTAGLAPDQFIDLTWSPGPARQPQRGPETAIGEHHGLISPPARDDLEVVDGFGHVRRIQPRANGVPTTREQRTKTRGSLSAFGRALGQALDQVYRAEGVQGSRTAAEAPDDTSNLYVMPDTDIALDARRHNPAPLPTVEPIWLRQSWDPLGRGIGALLEGIVVQGPNARDRAQRGQGAGDESRLRLGRRSGRQAGACGRNDAGPHTGRGTQPRGTSRSTSRTAAPEVATPYAAPPAEPLGMPPYNLTPQSTDGDVRAYLYQLADLIIAEVRLQMRILQAYILRHPDWTHQPGNLRSFQQGQVWLAQVQHFQARYAQRHRVDHRVLDIATQRFNPASPLSRMRQLIEMRVRRQTGLPQTQMSVPQELRLRVAVLREQLATLRGWSDTWKASLPTSFALPPSHVAMWPEGVMEEDSGVIVEGIPPRETEQMGQETAFFESL